MEFIVHQYVDDLFVHNAQVEFMKVKRKANWFGKLISHFYKNEELILVSTYNVFLLRKSISIKFQKFEDQISLIPHQGDYLLKKANELLSIKKTVGNSHYILYENGCEVGNVFIKGFQLPPYVYNMNFKETSQNNFYLLLLFLMDLPPAL